MNQSNKTPKTAAALSADEAKAFQKITLILIAVGAAAAICLVFFFCTFFRIKNSRNIPSISEARQLGATDSAVLLSWNAADPADGYRIRLTNDGGEFVSDCDLPYAVIRNLQPNRNYNVTVCAVKDGREYGARQLTCTTAEFCKVTKVTVTETGSDVVQVAWEYEGVNRGFQAVAYALDSRGRRHLTSEVMKIAADSKPQCRIDGLASELNYTVVIMPLTPYGQVGRLAFQTDKYSKKHNKINIIRFVICSATVTDGVQVQHLSKIQPAKHYKTSLLFNGKTDKNHTADFALLITDWDGNLISEERYSDVPTNPEDKQWFIHRSMLFDFDAPKQTGEYYLYLTIDGQTVYRLKFTVEL